MVYDDMGDRTDGSTLTDVAYLARSPHRLVMLAAIADEPRSRSELSELTGVSSSTIRRTIRGFDDRAWIRRLQGRYEVTHLGAFIATSMEELIDRINTERDLREIWDLLPGEEFGFTIDMCSKAVVTLADPDDPYAPLERFESLFNGTETVRFLRPEIALMEPCFEVLRGLIETGAEITFVDRPSCNTYFFSTYPEQSREMLRRENFTILEHEGLPPFGIGTLDDRITIVCYQPDIGAVRAILDSSETSVRAWARSTISSYENESEKLELPASLTTREADATSMDS